MTNSFFFCPLKMAVIMANFAPDFVQGPFSAVVLFTSLYARQAAADIELKEKT